MLETYIDMANIKYQQSGKAEIIKQFPEVTVTLKEQQRIMSGFYKAKGAPDYIGLIGKLPVCFDAKETAIKTNFPLHNVHDHQVAYFDRWENQGGKAFLIVCFTSMNETYLLPHDVLKERWQAAVAGGAKSIPLQIFRDHAILIKPGSGLTIDWLPAAMEERK
ncbi:Holliday junction resolvase RecU [Jeotgalibacillus terrae]|uniref:Holliday junction resolvase RecU n=1 Tax=Jeotgalibacillus terrae TaxID=587735 RepID=A0ABW5ZES8_9BACL|nr:Holliday junction resolvase RecU [Jeotgalibacillus terrae]MBM7577691.1 recombination protein U [Jeotgalibacillus terrae]